MGLTPQRDLFAPKGYLGFERVLVDQTLEGLGEPGAVAEAPQEARLGGACQERLPRAWRSPSRPEVTLNAGRRRRRRNAASHLDGGKQVNRG